MARGRSSEEKRLCLTPRRQIRASFALSPEGIDAFSAWLESQTGKLRLERRGVVRARLLAEELLLRLKDRFGADRSFDASLRAPFGRPQLRLELAGESFNPLSVPEDADPWSGMLHAAAVVDPRYSYAWDRNILRIPLPAVRRNPLLRLLVAVLIGCALGMLGKFLPLHGTLAHVGEHVFPVVYDLWTGILGALSGPVIFLMVITTILNTTRLTRQGGSRLFVVGRYFLLSFIASSLTVLLFGSFLRSTGDSGITKGSLWEHIPDIIQGFIPINIVEPFVTASTPQLLLLAFVLGGALAALGERGKPLRETTRQINEVGLRLCRWLSEAVPPFTAAFLMLEIWTDRTISLPQLWKPLASASALTLVLLGLALPAYALRLRIRPGALLRAIAGPVVENLRTGGQVDAVEDMGRALAKLGVDAKYARLTLPQGMVLFMPVSSVGVLVYSLYACAIWEVETDLIHLAAAVFLSVLLFVATPPVPGANLLAYTVLFRWLGLPADALIDAMVFDVLFGILAGAGNLYLLQLETLVGAKRIGLLDR